MKKLSAIHKKHLSEAKKGKLGEKSNAWKGGRHIGHGYQIININGKKRREHRLIMEKHLGRKLRSDEDVHHIDENRLNNNINNLEVMTKSEHARYHMSQGIPIKLIKHYNRNK